MEPRLFRDCCEGVLRSFSSGIEVDPSLLLVQFVDDPLIGGVSTFCLPSISHRVEVCYAILCLVFAGRVCVLVAIISVITITFHVCVCFCLSHQHGSFACLAVLLYTCLCLDVFPVCMASKIGECFAPPSSDGSQKCFKLVQA